MESFGIVPLEAALNGCHVFCGESTGITEYFPSNTVDVIETRILDSWVEKVGNFLCEPLSERVRQRTIVQEGAQEVLRIDASAALSELYRQFGS